MKGLRKGLQPEADDVRKGAATLTTAIDLLLAWLARDRTRTVKLSIKVKDQIQEFELSGSGINKEQLNSLVEIAMNKLRKTDE